MSDERYEKHMEMERQAKQAEQACGQRLAGDTRPTTEALVGSPLANQACVLPKDECAPRRPMVALSAHAAETLRCLFFYGPTYDGNVPSKIGRDELVNMGLAQRGNGYQWLTRAGIEACFANAIHGEKEARESRERQRRYVLEEAARQILT